MPRAIWNGVILAESSRTEVVEGTLGSGRPYGYSDPMPSDVKQRLDEAMLQKNWELVAELSKILAGGNRGRTG